VQILVLVLGVALTAGLRQLVRRTKLGKQMRAVAADREAAEMMGINVNFTIAATFFLGSALAGVAGVMGGLLFNQVTSTIGFIVGLKAFTAAVVGGIRLAARRDARRPAIGIAGRSSPDTSPRPTPTCSCSRS
jgi:branched-chain amino acid transport system permease protein